MDQSSKLGFREFPDEEGSPMIKNQLKPTKPKAKVGGPKPPTSQKGLDVVPDANDWELSGTEKSMQATKKKSRKQKDEEKQHKDLNINKYAGLTMYPYINKVYGPEFKGTDEASAYSCYLSCCGSACRTACCVCSACKCGPIVEVPQGNIGLVLEFGRFIQKLGPGLHTYNPCTQEMILCDLRIQTLQIPTQDLITKDNISLKIDCFVLFKILVPELASFTLDNYRSFISYTTMGTMKTIIAEKTLTEILAFEDEIEDLIKEIIDIQADKFGIDIVTLETKKIEVNRRMVSAMAKVAIAEKEMEGKLLSAKGDFESARIFREAADELSKNPLSLQLHYFETLREIASENCSVTIMPGELIDILM
jgi:erythrocyte band 7 integral membrane protein